MGITLRKQDVQQKALVNANSEEPMKVRVIPARKKFLPGTTGIGKEKSCCLLQSKFRK